MFSMLSRCWILILSGLVLSLTMPAAVLGQQRATQLTPRAQANAPAPQSSQAQPVATPATTQAQGNAPTSAAQQPASGPTAKAKETKGAWQLKISKGPPQNVSLKANNALVAEIAGELNRKLKVPVLLSPVMEKARVTVEFTNTQ